MKKIMKKIKSMGNERGVALVFTLAILSLLLVLGLSFVTDSLFEQKAAYNAANATSARFLAEAEVKKVITILKSYEDGDFYSHPTDNTDSRGDTTYDNLDRLSTTESGSPIFTWNTASCKNTIHWNYIKINDGSSDRIIGRTAYVLRPDSGLAPGSLVSKTVDEASFSEKRVGASVDEINAQSVVPSNPANSAVITSGIAGVFNWKTTEADVTQTNTAGRYIGSWQDFPTFFGAFSDAGQTLSPIAKNYFRTWFIMMAQNDPEAFWADFKNDSNIVRDEASADCEYMQRFNLARTDWNKATAADSKTFIYQDILLDSSGAGIPNIAMTKLGNTDLNGKGIPWLAMFGMKKGASTQTIGGVTYDEWVNDDTYKETFGDVVARRRQIAANLKDYCDDDEDVATKIKYNIPTSDVDPASWNTGSPTFTGNERTPYINEVGIYVKGLGSNQGTVGSPSEKSAISIEINAMAEIINIYSALDKSKPTNVKLKGTFTYRMKSVAPGDTYDVTTPTTNFDIDIPIISTNWGSPYQYATNEVQITIDENGAKKRDGTLTLDGIKITIERAVLSYNSENVDIALISQDTGSFALFTNYPLGSGDIEAGTYFSWQVRDARQNLNSGDWIRIPNTSESPYVFTNPTAASLLVEKAKVWTIKSKNNIGSFADPVLVNPKTTTKDTEDVEDPAYFDDGSSTAQISTAHIANKSMQSPWELGFIHRGAAWETINLKEYDKNKAIKVVAVGSNLYTMGGGKYSDITNGGGDANILDQIKMNSNKESPKKVNTKTHTPEVLKALFNKVCLGCVPDSTMSVNSIADSTNVIDSSNSSIFVNSPESGLVQDIIVTSSDSSKGFLTRAGIVQVPAMVSGTLCGFTRTTDAQKEELVGKIVNLTESVSRIEYFTLIVIAQAIRDVGTTTGIDINKTDKDGNVRTISGCKLGVFDFWYSSKDDFSSYVYADDIIAEQKIKVKGYRRGANDVVILSYEYVE